MDKVVVRTRRHAPSQDRHYWRAKTPAERLAALELLRQQHIAQLPVIDIEDFKANKRASGRLKDLADLEALDQPPDAS